MPFLVFYIFCQFLISKRDGVRSCLKSYSKLESVAATNPQDYEHVSAFVYLSQHLSDPTERLLYEKRILNKDGTDNFYPLDEGIRKMQRGLFALHMETPIGYRLVSRYFNEHEKCDLREIRYAEFTSPYFVSRKHSAFKEILRIV